MAGKPETQVGYILSGIPLGNLDREQVCQLIDDVAAALRHEGMFIQFQYSLIDRKKIKVRFARMRTVPVLLNVPPAVVYYAQKLVPQHERSSSRPGKAAARPHEVTSRR
jgi:phospholipid N-methyltransferase